MATARFGRWTWTHIFGVMQVIHVSRSLCPSSDYPPTHTACLNTSIYATSPSGVPSADQEIIVSYHNTLRRLQDATDMQLMIWDAEVAHVAQKLAGNCVFQHDTQRYIPEKYSAGQNIALGYTTWQAAIQGWYDEVRNFVYGDPNYTFSSIGHYTQIVWNSTAKIGCGFATCTNLSGKKFYVCNYAPEGNLDTQIPTPYTKGNKCAACPGSCVNGLCNCSGLVCKNGGTLNLNTCTCSCPSPYTGMPDCNTISTPTTVPAATTLPPTVATTTKNLATTEGPTIATTKTSTKTATTNPKTERMPETTRAPTTTRAIKTKNNTLASTTPPPTTVTTKATTRTVLTTRATMNVSTRATTKTVPPSTFAPTNVTTRGTTNTVPPTTQSPTTVTTRAATNTVSPTTPAPTTVIAVATTDTVRPTTLSQTTLTLGTATSPVQPTVTTRATNNTVPPTRSAPTTVTTEAITSTVYSKQTSNATPSGCPSSSYPPTHTACLSMSFFASNPRGVTATEKEQIIAYHNSLRARQTATDMQLTVWDDEVAFVAQKWSDNCDYRHDKERYIPGKYSAGQNIAYGFVSWNATIQAWYDEINLFTYGSPNYVFSDIGHYTQIVWNSTAKIGCGATTCKNLRSVYYVCNYAPAGNLDTSIPTPYTYGSKCSACTGRCKDGLCDCEGLVCKNGGTLSLNTCTCSCQSPYNAMPDCNLNCTGVKDQWYCRTQWPPSYCTIYSNVAFACPIMCGVCPGGSTVSLTSVTPSTAAPTSTAAAPTTGTAPKTGTSAAGSQTTASTTGAISMTRASSTGCPSPSYPSTHTACLNMSANAVNPRGVSAAEKLMIVAYHNNLRGMQSATDMQLMVWDDEVAYVAQKWSDNCVFEHDSGRRYIPDKYSAGQNIAYGYTSWNSTIQAWYDEIKDFTYGSTSYVFSDIGHYTQVVWNSTAKIGCGATTCSSLRAMFYVCNYAPAGNLDTQIPTPYTRGNKCAACPGRCVNGLCDCSGLVCKNGGTLNLNTCTCSCPSPYTGMPDCNLNCTGVVDEWYCDQYPASYCTRYYNVPLECPRWCGICPAV